MSHKAEPDHNDCRCPKWLYEFVRGGKPIRRSLVTPSWAEAQRRASEALRGFDPEIKASRDQQNKKQKQRVTVKDACQRWLDNAGKKSGATGVFISYQSLTRKVIRWAEDQGYEYIQASQPTRSMRGPHPRNGRSILR